MRKYAGEHGAEQLVLVPVLCRPGRNDVTEVDNRVGGPSLHLAVGGLLGHACGGTARVAPNVPQEDVHGGTGNSGTPGAVGSGERNVDARLRQRDLPTQVRLDRLINKLDQPQAPVNVGKKRAG